LSTRIVRSVINGRDTYRMRLVCDGYPTRRHPVGDGRVSLDLGPSEIAVAVQRTNGTCAGWSEPLADRIRLNTLRLRRQQRHLDRQHRAGSPGFFNPDGTHQSGRCDWRRSHAAKQSIARVAERHRRLAEHRKTLPGALANRLFTHGADVACEKLDYRPAGPGGSQPRLAGSTVRTLMGRRGPVAQQYPSGEAADIRRRGGQGRAAKPGVKPKPRCDRAGRRELPLPPGPRRCPHEQRDSRLARGIPAIHCGEDVNRSHSRGMSLLQLTHSGR